MRTEDVQVHSTAAAKRAFVKMDKQKQDRQVNRARWNKPLRKPSLVLAS